MGKDEETELVIQGFDIGFVKTKKLNCEAQRHHYSMFSVGRSVFDVNLLKRPCTA
jgi:hypothetical protein